MSTKITNILKVIDDEYGKAKKYFDLSKESAQEIAKTALTSHSQAGDRFHSQGAMEISKERLNGISKLKAELEKVKERENLEFVEVPCYIKTDKAEFYLVENTILINGIKLVSSNSEIGKELINKQVGDVVNGFKILELE